MEKSDVKHCNAEDHIISVHKVENAGQNSGHALGLSSRRGSNPEQIAYNMNDLTAADLNSADDIRMLMKEAHGGKFAQSYDGKLDHCTTSNPEPKSPTNLPKNKSIATQHIGKTNLMHKIDGKKTIENRSSAQPRKRPGRPPMAGTAKRMRKTSVTAIYLGKLSNVVQFRSRRSKPETDDSESESDDGSEVSYY